MPTQRHASVSRRMISRSPILAGFAWVGAPARGATEGGFFGAAVTAASAIYGTWNGMLLESVPPDVTTLTSAVVAPEDPSPNAYILPSPEPT
jgi:hypothetical protein